MGAQKSQTQDLLRRNAKNISEKLEEYSKQIEQLFHCPQSQ